MTPRAGSQVRGPDLVLVDETLENFVGDWRALIRVRRERDGSLTISAATVPASAEGAARWKGVRNAGELISAVSEAAESLYLGDGNEYLSAALPLLENWNPSVATAVRAGLGGAGDATWTAVPVYVSEEADLPFRTRAMPRTARLLATVEWLWGPAHSRTDRLFISLDGTRQYWILWAPWRQGGETDDRIMSYIERRGISARDAALRLLVCGYKGEESQYESPGGRWHRVRAFGLLEEADLNQAAATIW